MSQPDEEEKQRLSDLAIKLIGVVDHLAGALPEEYDSDPSPWCKDIRTIFSMIAHHRTQNIEKVGKEMMDRYVNKHTSKVADQHEQETFGIINIETTGDPVSPEDLIIIQDGKELDPSGLDPHAPGAKLDAGKPMVDDILAGFPRALMGVVEVGTFGAKKYSLNGYKEVENAVRRYRNAAGRHRLAIQRGETHDQDSKLLHRFHEAWNVLASLELELEEKS